MKGPYSHPGEKGLYGIFNDSFPPILDGVTLTVENYVHWLQERGRTPCVVTPWNPVKNEANCSVMRYFSLPIHNRKPYRYGYPKLDPFIWSRLKNTNFRILHSHCPFSSGRLAVYVKRHQDIPLIGTFHSKYKSDLEHSFKRMPWCVPIIMKRILNFFNACDEVWIPQAHVEETVREYGFKGKLTVVENGNDFASFMIGDRDEFKRNARQRLGIEEDAFHLLFVGQHIWEKGLAVIVDTLSELKGKIKYKMTFVGNGYAADDLREMIAKRGLADSVSIVGVVKDRMLLSDYYAAGDLFIFPSLYDNAPLVVREAAAMSTPALLVDGSTAAEVVKNGVNGFLTARDPKKMADLICQLNADRGQLRMVAEGARASLIRSWEDVVGEVIDRYDVILKNYKRR